VAGSRPSQSPAQASQKSAEEIVILLDTNHVTVLRYVNHPRSVALLTRLQSVPGEVIATTVITLEEQTRGWLSEINRWRDVHKQIIAYEKLSGLFRFYSRWEIVSFDRLAADEFEGFRRKRIRIGTLDLKIGSITVVHNALLLSANMRDFQKVPGLRVQNWLA
jgi:tRNA(fMet)-specific endonuclease VapC